MKNSILFVHPNASRKIPSNLEKKIDEDLGGIEKMRSDFINAGVTQFGSGWCWLELKDGKLNISKTNVDFSKKNSMCLSELL